MTPGNYTGDSHTPLHLFVQRQGLRVLSPYDLLLTTVLGQLKQISDLGATDRCVMCGLCLPHCPTYEETRDEGDSPRGRIALMRALQTNALQNNTRLVRHLDHCLGCRACEAMCPSQVPFGPLMDQARHILHSRRLQSREPFYRFMTDRILTRPKSLRIVTSLLRFYQRSGLRFLAQRSGLLSLVGAHRLDQLLPQLTSPIRWRSYYPAKNLEKGQVALFLGCIARFVDTETIISTIGVLNQLGYGVHIPAKQTCCGALHQHDGKLEHARRLAQQNIAAFQGLPVKAVLNTASGCGVQLSEYRRGIITDPAIQPQAAAFSAQVQDISTFLAGLEWPDSIELEPLQRRIAVHEPCSLRNVLKQGYAAHQLLQRIPEINLVSASNPGGCCGAAGNYFLLQPVMADLLRDKGLDDLERLRPDLITTSNIGCALHLQAGLRQSNLDLEVIHPVTLIHRQLLRQHQN